MREDERQLTARDMTSTIITIPTTAPEINFANAHLSHSDMNKIIFNYLITDGNLELAETFRQEAQLNREPAVQPESAAPRVEVKEKILLGEIESAIEKISDSYPELLDGHSNLHFHLLQQHLIELIRKGDNTEAVNFAQNYIAKKGNLNASILAELEQTLALLAFPKPATSPFSDLLELSQRQKTAREVNSAILVSEGQAPVSQLETVLKLLLYVEEQLDRKSIEHPKLDDVFKDMLT